MNSSNRPWVLVLAGGVLLGLTPIVLWFMEARNTPSQNSCLNMLRQIDGAKQQWAVEAHKTRDDLPTWAEIAPYWKEKPYCPQGGTYTLGAVGAPDSCSIPKHDRVWKEMQRAADESMQRTEPIRD